MVGARTPRPERIAPGPGQESVWDYPRPPIAERVARRIRIVLGGETIVAAPEAWRVLETSHPPTYYIAPVHVAAGALTPVAGRTLCEWKGAAAYFDVQAGGARAARAAWSYPAPTARFAAIKDHLAFYAGAMDACFVDDERVAPQIGGFYGGWATSDIVGPFKGAPGAEGW